MAVKNSTILEACLVQGSDDFAQRVPNPSIEGYAETVKFLFDPLNARFFNEFTGLLNGVIGPFVEVKLFENPLRVLKKPMMEFGNVERRVAVKYLQAHAFNPNSETLLKVERPEFVEWFYSINQQRRYEFSWTRIELRRAFAQDGYGFEDLLQATFTQAYSSDNYDEMNVMIHAFAEADTRLGNGLYRYQLSAAPTDEATAKELLKGIRTIAGKMKYPTRLYNHIPVPVHETADTLVVWVTPETLSSIDVDALSAVFQLDRASIQYRIIEIPEFPIPNVYAAITSEDFIWARDSYYGFEPPMYNPENLSFKYYLHHQQMIGVNPAANAVLFTTDEATNIPTVTVSPSGLAFDPATGNIEIGGTLKLNPELSGTVTANDAGIAVEPDSCLYTVVATRTGEGGTTEAVELNSRTFVDDRNVLHLQKSGIEVGDVLTITGVSTYINPSGATSVYTATFTATVVAATTQGAKECAVAEKPYIEYTDETEDVTASE